MYEVKELDIFSSFTYVLYLKTEILWCNINIYNSWVHTFLKFDFYNYMEIM